MVLFGFQFYPVCNLRKFTESLVSGADPGIFDGGGGGVQT